MEQYCVIKSMKEFKKVLAHISGGGSIYINKALEKEIKALNGKDTERLLDELSLRGVKIKVKN